MMKKTKFEVKAWQIQDGTSKSEILNHLLVARGHSMKTFAVVCDPSTLNNILNVVRS